MDGLVSCSVLDQFVCWWVTQTVCFQTSTSILADPLKSTSTFSHNHSSALRSSPVPETDIARATLEAEATRLGSRALLCNALASLIASIICPLFVSNASSSMTAIRGRPENDNRSWVGGLKRRWKQRPKCHLALLWSVSHGIFAACMLSTL